MSNTSISVSEFILHCEIRSDQRSGIISALTLIFFTSMFGNLLVITVIIANRHLHAPMYLYIVTLATIDLTNTIVLIPKMFSILLFDSSVPYAACVLQMFIVFHIDEMEALLLAFMAIDRYVAVLYPLRYPSLITNKTVGYSVLIMNIFGLIFKSPFLFFVGELSFCQTNILPYCFCDYSTMVHIACNQNPKYLSFLSAAVFTTGVVPLGLLLFTYSRVVLAAIMISSAEGKKKVFSTCLTHLLVVGLFYIPLLLSYLLPGAGVKLSTEAYNAMVIVGNVLPPMLNPIIYSFRNKEIKVCIHRLFTGKRNQASVNHH
ncbi:olfactory receptor 1E5-like [Erpetoichthys calabaricus]|uniref:olfactory receptor 1E5-like n=1 Tax=Erpetoichthys calabaricus TaxID=27687 RepID=UPI0022343A3E|nr:olfactory receptor 1E5-like [Erpetoichthys calabaricus]XP_051782657.1 olfactory receptor 1E5-like [Erpetoichthys calabaricus]